MELKYYQAEDKKQISTPYAHILLLLDPLPTQRADAADSDSKPDRPMDFDEEPQERDFTDQGPLTDMDMDSLWTKTPRC